MAKKKAKVKRTAKPKRPAAGNAEGVWAAVTRMLDDPRFEARVVKSADTALASYKLSAAEVRLIAKAGAEGLDKVFAGKPGPSGKSLATQMAKMRRRVGSDARNALNDAAFRRFIDPLRLHAMHEVL